MSDEQEKSPPVRRRSRRFWLGIALGVVVLGLGIFVAGVTVWEYTNSTAFCGTTCHTMPPEFTAYQVSPHARVACVDCHLGQEGVLYAFPRKAAEIRHLTDVLTSKYETPVYVRNLRPARFTCEQCHFPEKFATDRVRQISHFLSDKSNTEMKIWLVMKTGGGSSREGLGKGIHWHIENEVWYLATDELKQQIPYVRQIDADGTVTEYFDAEAGISPEFIAKSNEQLRRMDCIDCHNRISHSFRSPETIIDTALERNQIDSSIPDFKQLATALFSVPYKSHEEAEKSFDQLSAWYQANYPSFYSTNQQSIQQAIDKLKESYRTSVFPDMGVGWETHPDNLGHTEFPGCFRCHDGKHTSTANTTIRLECNICHSIPEVYKAGEPAPIISLVKPPEPESHLNTNWLAQHRYQFDATCINCHSVTNPGGSDNSSFCSNSACHATEWKYVGLDAAAIRAVSEPPRVPSSGVPRAIPHPIGPGTDCRLCHAADKTRPWPANHESMTVDLCTLCHQATLRDDGVTVPATTGEASPTDAPPAIPHELAGRENCLLCHNPEGDIKPAPKSHAGRTVEACQVCHKPAQAGLSSDAPAESEGEAEGPPGIPHELAGRDQCLVCHNPEGGVKPAPSDHAGRGNETCQACHKPES